MSKLDKSKINAYVFYTFASSVGVVVPLNYLNIFMTENLGYSAALMGTTLLIPRIIDFVVGLLAGGIIEKSRLKWGKFRSWIMIFRFVVFAGCAVLFLNTSALPVGTKMLITILGYVMLHCSMNFLQTAQFGILSVMAGADMEDRNTLSIRSGQAAAASMILTSMITLPFIEFLTPIVGNSNAYLIAAALFAAVFFIGCTVLGRAAAPYDLPRSKEEVKNVPTATVKDMINSVVTNKQLLIYILSSSLFYVGMMLFAGITAYYFMYVLGNFLLMSVSMTATTVFSLVASIIGPKMGMKLGKKNAMVVGLFIYAAGSIGIALFAKNSLIIFIILSCVNGLGMYFFQGFGPNYVIDTGEYGFYKTGKDNRAVAMGMMNMPMKIGMMVGGSLGGYGLQMIGYTAGMVPTAEFVSKFMLLLGGVPAIFYIVAAIIMLVGYKISDEDAAMYAKANAEKMLQSKSPSVV